MPDHWSEASFSSRYGALLEMESGEPRLTTRRGGDYMILVFENAERLLWVEVEEHPVDIRRMPAGTVLVPLGVVTGSSRIALEPTAIAMVVLPSSRAGVAKAFLTLASNGNVRCLIGSQMAVFLGDPPSVEEAVDLALSLGCKLDRPLLRGGVVRRGELPAEDPRSTRGSIAPSTLRAREFLRETVPGWAQRFSTLRGAAAAASAQRSDSILEGLEAKFREDVARAAQEFTDPYAIERATAEVVFAEQEFGESLRMFSEVFLPGAAEQIHPSQLFLAACDGYAGAVSEVLDITSPVVLPGTAYFTTSIPSADSFLHLPSHLCVRTGSYPLIALGAAELWAKQRGLWSKDSEAPVLDDWTHSDIVTVVGWLAVGTPLEQAIKRFGDPRHPVAEQWNFILIDSVRSVEGALRERFRIPRVHYEPLLRQSVRVSLERGKARPDAPLLAVELLLDHAFEGRSYINEAAVLASLLTT